jgi:hypothetical protein
VNGRDAKLARLVERLVAAEAGALSDGGREYMRQALRWRLGLRSAQPHLSARGRPLDVVRYERQIIDTRVSRALEQPGVAEETEAVGAVVR